MAHYQKETLYVPKQLDDINRKTIQRIFSSKLFIEHSLPISFTVVRFNVVRSFLIEKLSDKTITCSILDNMYNNCAQIKSRCTHTTWMQEIVIFSGQTSNGFRHSSFTSHRRGNDYNAVRPNKNVLVAPVFLLHRKCNCVMYQYGKNN